MKQQSPPPFSRPCAQWRQQLASVHQDDLTLDEKKALNAHIVTCPACARVQAEYRAMDSAIKHLPPIQKLATLPPELAALARDYQKREDVLHEARPERAGLRFAVQLISARQSERQSEQESRRSSRFIRMVSSIAALLVVAFIGGGAFILFSHTFAPGSTVVGALAPAASKLVLYTSPEIPGQVKLANIYAVNPTDGSIYWKAALNTKLTSSDLRPYKDLLFAPGYDGNLYALSATTGNVLWKYSVKNDPAPTMAAGTNVPSSPIADGDAVYFGAESGIYAVDIHTGKQLWHVQTPGSCKPAQVEQHGNQTIVKSGPTCTSLVGSVVNGNVYAYFDGLYALDARTGQQLWHDTRFQFEGREGVVVAGDRVYATSLSSGGLFILNTSDGKEVMKVANSGGKSGGMPGSILVADGIVYYDDGNELLALQGTQVLWTKKYAASPLAASNGSLFVSSMWPLNQSQQTGKDMGTYFYALDAATGTIKWYWGEKSADGQSSWGPGSPISENGKLYFFFPVQQGKNWVNALWVLHDNKRDLYPLKES